MSWEEHAACRDAPDPEVFFPPKGGTTKAAKDICRVCPVKIPCLNEALRHKINHGVWGSMSERERRRLLRIAA